MKFIICTKSIFTHPDSQHQLVGAGYAKLEFGYGSRFDLYTINAHICDSCVDEMFINGVFDDAKCENDLTGGEESPEYIRNYILEAKKHKKFNIMINVHRDQISKSLDIIHIFSYGSRVYGTYSETSDYDYIVVSDKTCELSFDFGNVTSYTESDFIKKLNDNEISVLECMYLPSDKVLSTKPLDYKYTFDNLRHSISKRASNSFVKAKKKMTVGSIVPMETDMLIGLKSAFHSIRILDFGTQLAKTGKINDYSSVNKHWNWIKEITDWNTLNSKLKPIYNQFHSVFVESSPK